MKTVRAQGSLGGAGLCVALLAGVLFSGETMGNEAGRAPASIALRRDGGDASRPEDLPKPEGLNPRGRVHIPIGIPDSLDAVKTFVEAEGGFSPGLGSWGVYLWLRDPECGDLQAATGDGVECEHGLAPSGLPIPWTRWRAGPVEVRSEVCEVDRRVGERVGYVVGSRARLRNRSASACRFSLFVALRPLGPAGGPVRRIEAAVPRDALLVDGRVALVAERPADAIGVRPFDDVGSFAARGLVPESMRAESVEGNASGLLRFDLELPAGGEVTLGFISPVLAGRRAPRHHWDGVSTWAQLDLAVPDPPEGGVLQPTLSLGACRSLRVDDIFAQAHRYWTEFFGAVRLRLPDSRWSDAWRAIVAHAALAMNEGAPDVAVVNYNVFNRDGVYVVSILQKAGRADLAARAIDWFLHHPFNGRSYPEADNPGQILWILGEHWRFGRDREWLGHVMPEVRKLVALVRYLRATPGPHHVRLDGLEYGAAVPPELRRELEPGRCDGHHPEYTEAFDVAGLRAAVELARAAGADDEAEEWGALAERLAAAYDRAFSGRLARGYGSYCVLWPCRLLPLDGPRAREAFGTIGGQVPGAWRYFALARAHQGLLAGRRDAAWATLHSHLDHPQMRGWYAFDEGGKSGPGGWRHLRTTWDPNVAMPHGWAIAELSLLLRDALAFEDRDRLVLLGGVPPAWLEAEGGFRVAGMPTHFGPLDLEWTRTGARRARRLRLAGARPPGGFELRVPSGRIDSLRGPEGEISPIAPGRFPLARAGGDFEVRLAPSSGRGPETDPEARSPAGAPGANPGAAPGRPEASRKPQGP